jgi:hypothetical protein
MYYVVEELNAPIVQGKLYVGSEIKNFYKTDAFDSYDNGIAQGIATGADGLMYTIIRIKDQIGWDPFIKTFRNLNESPFTQATQWDKFNVFLDKLTEYSGKNVRQTYPPGELDVIRELLSQ